MGKRIKKIRNGLIILLIGGMIVGLGIPFALAQEQPFKGVTIRMQILSGDHPIPFKRFIPAFEKKTGAKVELYDIPFGVVYDKVMSEMVAETRAYDIIEIASFWVGDFIPYVRQLDDYIAEADPWLSDIMPAFRKQWKWGDHYYAMVYDGDVFALYYGKDLLAKYGLLVPTTWNEYLNVAKKVTGIEPNLYGHGMMLNRVHGSFSFVQLFLSCGGQFFDPQTMEPGINKEPGITALEWIRESMQYAPPGSLDYGFTATRDAFAAGDIAMLVQWPDIGGWTAKPEVSNVVGKVGYDLVPGGIVNGKINQVALLPWGWSHLIPKTAKHPKAAYEFLRYMQSPEISLEVVKMARGYDPFRIAHFQDPEFRMSFDGADKFLDNLQANVKIGVPDLRIPGAYRYYDSIAVNMGRALAREITVQEALDKIAEEWNRLTGQLGKKRQLTAYRESIAAW